LLKGVLFIKKLLFLTVTAILSWGPPDVICLAEVQSPPIDQERTDKKAGLKWKDNSKAMFEKVVQSSPEFIRPMSEKNLREAIITKAGERGVVTEDMVIECTKEVTPAPFVKQTLKDLEPLRTK
jgi:hypothetical protein